MNTFLRILRNGASAAWPSIAMIAIAYGLAYVFSTLPFWVGCSALIAILVLGIGTLMEIYG